MSATKRLRELLDERGVEYGFVHGYKIFYWDYEGANGKGSVSATEVDSGINIIACGLTPEQAIAATLGRGMLTADDVRDLIERHSDASGGNGRDFHNGAYAAIADELNAMLGCDAGATDARPTQAGLSGTCHDTHEARWFRCSACGFGIEDMYLTDEDEYPPEDQPRYCPNCGAKVSK